MNGKDILRGGVNLSLALGLCLSKPESVQAVGTRGVCEPGGIGLVSYKEGDRGSCRVKLVAGEGFNLHLGEPDSYDILSFLYHDYGDGVLHLDVSLICLNCVFDWIISSEAPKVGETVEMEQAGVSVRITGLEDGSFLVSYTKVEMPPEQEYQPYLPFDKQRDA